MLRTFSCLVFVILLGCTPTGTERTSRPSSDASIDIESASLDNGAVLDSTAIDSGGVVSTVDTNVAVDGIGAGDTGSVDGLTGAVDTEGGVACVQRAIDNGYASCALNDVYRASCDACTDDRNLANAQRCRSMVDCLLKHPNCDVACAQKCEGVPTNGLVLLCAFKVVSPFCGRVPWRSTPPWGCEKAL